MEPRFALATSCLLLAALAPTPSRAQVGVLPIQPNQASYSVRLVNEMGYPIRVKMVRFGSGRYLEEDLRVNGSVTRELYAGDRVLCVWNRGQTLTLAAQVNVNTSGTLRIRPVSFPMAAQAESAGTPRRRGGAAAMEPLPRLKLE